MPHYKDLENKVHFLDLEGFEHFLPAGSVKISDEEADSLTSALVYKPTYAELRSAEYPPVADYLDAVVKGDQAQIEAYISACLAIKAKYPKE